LCGFDAEAAFQVVLKCRPEQINDHAVLGRGYALSSLSLLKEKMNSTKSL
jgi:hypothetical protein